MSFSDIKYIEKKCSKLSSKEQAIEFIRCKTNPFYFIYNYVVIQEIGSVIKYTPEKMHPKFRQIVRVVMKYHKAVNMATRQLGKSTIAACLLEWAGNFYPKTPITILNANKTYSQENLSKIKFVH